MVTDYNTRKMREYIINGLDENLKDMYDAIREQCKDVLTPQQIGLIHLWFKDFQDQNKEIVYECMGHK